MAIQASSTGREPFSPTASREEILDALQEALDTQRRLR